MKHKILPAILVAIIFSVWEVPLPFAKILFSIGLFIGIIAVVLDLVFFNVISTSTRIKAIDFFAKFVKDVRAQYLRASMRSALVCAIPVFYIEVPILFMYASLAYIFTSLTYFAYLGHNYSEDLTNPEDFIDGE